MTALDVSACCGLWRRTLLVEADGSRDTGPGVVWLQGITAYVDTRGFAGTLHQCDGVFQWRRTVDAEPPGPLPDEGEMRWEGDTLVETGVHADYVEHWARDDAPRRPCWAAFLAGPGGAPGLLLRVGSEFGFARGGAVVIETVGSPAWTDIVFGPERVVAGGAEWTVEHTEGEMD